MEWHGFRCESFDFEGREAFLTFPEKSDRQRNWVLKTEYRTAFPETEIELLKRGFHVAFLHNKTRFATREDCDAKARFAQFLRDNYGLRDKCVPVGFSCGGAHAVNFCGAYPELVACMFLDAPVLNFLSYPGRLDRDDCVKVWENEFVHAYPNVRREDLFCFDGHPICKIRGLIEHKIPILMMYGTEDELVPYAENGKRMEEIYRNAPSLLTVIPRPLQGHHPHGDPEHPEKIADWIVDACE